MVRLGNPGTVRSSQRQSLVVNHKNLGSRAVQMLPGGSHWVGASWQLAVKEKILKSCVVGPW